MGSVEMRENISGYSEYLMTLRGDPLTQSKVTCTLPGALNFDKYINMSPASTVAVRNPVYMAGGLACAFVTSLRFRVWLKHFSYLFWPTVDLW